MSDNSFSDDLIKIVSDNKSGSRELLDNLHQYLKSNQDEIDKELIMYLSERLSEFQSIKNYLDDLNSALEKNSVTDFFERREEDSKNIFNNIFDNLKPEIELFNSFITISNSKTIFEILKLLSHKKSNLRIRVSEGRPICEGRLLAENLAQANISVFLITEAQIYDAIQKVECGIIGADKILPNGNVINKVGSSLLALASKEFNKPFYVIADKSKLSKLNSFEKIKKPVEEIYSTNKNIEMNNFYFEEIPKELITKVITD